MTTTKNEAAVVVGMMRVYLRLGTVKQTETVMGARRRILESLAAESSAAVAAVGF